MVDDCPLPRNIPGWGDAVNVQWTKVRSFCKPIIKECVEKHNLDLELFAAVIMQESKGDSNAINPDSGATGLSQVMPDSAIPGRPTQDELLEPIFNIGYGCGILAHEINEWGSIKDGLWSYNGKANSYAEYADIVLGLYNDIKAAP